MAIEDLATVCDGSFQIGEGLEAQMICHMRYESSPQLMALQPICIPNRRESPADSISRRPYDTNKRIAEVSLRTADEAARAIQAQGNAKQVRRVA